MRKLLLLGAAALLAFKGGKGMSREAQNGRSRPVRPSPLTFGSILSLLLVPRALRPVMLLSAVASARRRQRR